jgi:DNA repair exonuclease SbcCD ATPase subunit
MRLQQGLSLLALAAVFSVLVGCADETAGLKQKIAEIEKKVEKQQKDFGELAGGLSPQKDFSSDIQRIEDQQERISQILKTQVEPIHTRLEEFRDWAQETQKEREENRQKLKNLAQFRAEIQKTVESGAKEIHRLERESALQKKKLTSAGKSLDDLAKGMAEVRKEILDNNAKLVEAVKKTLPKVRDSAVYQVKDRLTPLEKTLKGLQAEMEKDRKAIEALQARISQAAPGRDVNALIQRFKELEEVVTSQKSYLLELGSQVHELQIRIGQLSGDASEPSPVASRR